MQFHVKICIYIIIYNHIHVYVIGRWTLHVIDHPHRVVTTLVCVSCLCDPVHCGKVAPQGVEVWISVGMGPANKTRRYNVTTSLICFANERFRYIVMTSLIGWAHA